MGDVATAALGGGVRPGVAWAGRARSARRCLFGPPDPEKTRDFLESETERLEGESRAKWNFDFVSERPLDCGRFVWTEVGDHGKGTGKAELQTRITDFMRKRKLPTHPKEEPTPSEGEDGEPQSKTRRRFST